MAQETYAGWPLIEIYGVGPDGTCHCPAGAKCPPKSRGKHPRGNDWQKSERVDVEAMLKRRPRANLGTLTGDPAGFWVLDIDEGGMTAMQALIREHGLLPETRVHRTGGGTYHYFFAMPDFDVTNRRGDLPAGIDVRGTGGQVVLPPSRSGKGDYTVVRNGPILPAPAWLLDKIRPSDAPEYDEGGDLPGGITEVTNDTDEPIVVTPPLPPREQTPREAKYESSIVAGEIARLAAMSAAKTDDLAAYRGDPWDWTTFMASCQLVELANADWSALTLAEAREIVLEHAPRDAGFDDNRVKEKFESARRKVGDKKRPAPVDNTSWMDEIEAVESPAATPSQKAAPAVRKTDPEDFFGKNGVEVIDLANEIMARGPIRMGQDGRWWTYDDRGVWVEDRHAVTNRTIDILGNRFRTAHAGNTEAVVRRFAPPLEIDTPDPAVINFANGMLHWKSGQMTDHSPEFGSSVQIPHVYDADATCPRFDAFLDSVMSPDYQKLTWEMIGYLLYSGNPMQVAFLLHGSGENGKGTLIKVLTEMLGKHNIANQSLDSLNKDKFAPASLFGKIANIAGDIDATFQDSTAKFKMLTGEDRMGGEHKYGDSFGFNNFAVPLFSANKIPGSADVSKGYLRRWVNIEFDRQFTGDPIRGLGESLAATEIPGIIARGIRTLVELMERGKFTIDGEATKGKDEFAKKIDQVRQWVEEECLEVADATESRTDLYRDYGFWAAREGNPKISGREFYARLEGIGFSQRRSNGVRLFEGIALVHKDRFHGGTSKGKTDNESWMEAMD